MAEIRDIVADPLQCGDQVEHSGIGRVREFFAAKCHKIQKPKNVEAVIDGNDDDISAPG